MLGCGTAVLPCGCTSAVSMFSDNSWMYLSICAVHLQMPEVQEAQVKDVWQVIIDHPAPSPESSEEEDIYYIGQNG